MDFFLTVVVAIVTLVSNCSSTLVRLVGGSHPYEGRVEVYHNGWGTVCDDGFGTEEALVICRKLGYHWTAVSYQSAHFGAGSLPILLDDLTCTGRETDISQCGSRGWGKHNCIHNEDASVSCAYNTPAITLIGGRGNFEGTVEIDHGSLCNRSFTDNDAIVLCRMVGFTSGVAVTGAKFGQMSNGLIRGMNLHCQGNEHLVQQCTGYNSSGWGQPSGCDHSMDAGVICDHTPVRLVDGALPSEGRLEVQHNGLWGSVCGSGFSNNEADVVCRMLGFTSSASAVKYGVTGGKGPVWLDSISCHGSETDLKYCNVGSWGNNSCDHRSDIGLTCTPSDVRLMGGAGPWEGTLQVYMNNKWGTVCDPDFGDTDADVVCRMLGYTRRGAPHTIYHTDYFSHHTSPVLNKVRCRGDESDIRHCVNDIYTSCSTSQTVGLKCEGVQVRLVGGAHISEGRIEILQGGVWGTICDDGWDDVDATVVCKMLSSFPFDGEVTGTALPRSYFGHGTGPVWMSRSACNGSESGISSCNADWTGGVNCDHSRDAGVLCDFHRPKHLEGSQHSNGTLREVHQGYSRVYCPTGWNVTDADAICREIGYISPQAVVYSYRYTVSSSYMNVLQPACAGDEGHLEMCPMLTRLGQNRCSSNSYSLGVDCRPQALDSTRIRLVDGPGPWKGRLEVLSNGIWGSFSFNTWNDSYSDAVCSQLGFTVTPKNTTTSYPTSKGLTSLLYRGMDCDASQVVLGLCKMNYNISECKSTSCQAVGIDCSDGVSAELSNATSFSGGVTLNTANGTSWSVCYDELDNRSASVICSMTGYADTKAVITRFSSQTNELYSAIQCAGWETHVGQCHVSQNYTGCNDKAAVKCFDQDCTISDTRTTGSAVSPHYPSSYPLNKDCMYVIIPRGGGAIKLVFNDLNLDGDGDYIEVRDGPHGIQLGNFSTSSNVPFLVSNDGFYIRFKTNGHRGSAIGFNVSWSPVNIEDAVKMGCGQHGWDIAVNTTILRHLFPDTGVSQIKLSDQMCTGKIDGDLLVFRQSFTECSTQSKPTSTNVIYTNSLLYPEASSPFPLIVHGYRWKVDVECDITRGQTIVNTFNPNQTVSHQSPHVGSSSNYATAVKFFTDGSFFTEIKGNPVSIKTGDDVFVKVKMDSDDTHVKMILDTCYAKPDPNADQSMTYTLINNGCVSDSYTRIISQGTHETRFVFNAFEFPANHDSVYVYCNTTFCPVTDTSSPCTQTCHMARPSLVGRAVAVVDREKDMFNIKYYV